MNAQNSTKDDNSDKMKTDDYLKGLKSSKNGRNEQRRFKKDENPSNNHDMFGRKHFTKLWDKLNH